MDAITSLQQPSQGTYSHTAAGELRQAIAAAHGPLRDAVTAYKAASAGLKPDADLLEVLRSAGQTVLAAEMLVAASKALEASARAALASTLLDTGACSIRSTTHTFSASQGRPSVTITSADAVPAHLLRQPPPSPDKARILALLKAGETVPGCELSNGSQPILTVKAVQP